MTRDQLPDGEKRQSNERQSVGRIGEGPQQCHDVLGFLAKEQALS